MTEGSRVVGTHQDSPHIELKGRPILAAGDFAMFKSTVCHNFANGFLRIQRSGGKR